MARLRKNEWLLCLACLLLIGVIFSSGVLSGQKVWPSLSMTLTQADGVWRTEEGDTYGVVAKSVPMNLPAGTYRLRWWLGGDAAARIRLTCVNDAQITPAVIETAAGVWEEEAVFELAENTSEFRFEIEFAGGTWLGFENLRLYSPEYTDHAFTAAAVLLLLCALLIAHGRGALTPSRVGRLAVLGLAVLITSRMFWQENSPMGWDSQFHGQRILNLADGLRSGQFPVRVGGTSYNGYGAVTSVFYPDLLLYPWALMLLAGASMTYVLNTLAIAAHMLAAASMYAAAKRLFQNKQAAVCAGVLLLGSLYWARLVYRRFALGEMLGTALLPLFLLALYEVLFGEKKRWPLLAVSATLIFRSHMLATLFCLILALCGGVLCIRRIVREKRLAPIALACGCALLLNLNQIVPLVTMYLGGVNTAPQNYRFVNHLYSITSLLGTEDGIGLALLIGAALFLCAQERIAPGRERHIGWLALSIGAFCMLLATDIIPWSYVVALTGEMMEIVQFPERFLLIASVCLALCGGLGFARVFDGRGMQACAAALAVTLAIAMPYAQDVAEMGEMAYGCSVDPCMYYPEYQLEGTNVADTLSREPLAGEGLTIEAYQKDGTEASMRVQAQRDTSVTLPMFAFDGYAVTLDGESVPYERGENNRLRVNIPAGTQGELRVRYEGKAIWRAADAVSLLTAAAFAVYCVKGKKLRIGAA